MRRKYPKTFHLPWSENLENDDRLIPSLDELVGKKVVVTEKLDGENTTMYSDYIHARSLDSRNHPSRNWVKGFHALIGPQIPQGWRVVGENMYATHSIHYTQLPTYFLVFSIWDNDFCLDWESTKEYAAMLGVQTVPELYVGPWDEEIIRSLHTGVSKFGGEQEGYVVRTWDGFDFSDFQSHVAKFVRAAHIRTSKLWMNQPVVPNLLA